ncbi:MAG: ribosome recycling factor [Candidatus Campbellbacteria bacterium]|nr:ribosome recycling factor [Candidatus Campbellbacteria bacterium]
MSYSFDTFRRSLNNTEEWLKKELASIRTGQASPTVLDSVTVEVHGARLPLNQVANISLEGSRALRVNVWDKNQIKAVEKAIRDRDLGLSIATDDSGVRIFFPEVTTEQKEKFVKLAKDRLEQARIAVRGEREDTLKEIQDLEKSSEISEDEAFSLKEQLQKQVDEKNQDLSEIFERKENEILST